MPYRNFWSIARQKGFETMMEEDLSKAPRKHNVDVRIAATILKDACGRISPAADRIVLVAGDGDFAPAIELLKEDGFEVDVIFWGHASYQIRNAASTFTSLDDHFEFLRFRWKEMKT